MSTTKQTESTARNTSTNRVSTAPKTKKETVIGLLTRSKGATIADLQRATGWQAHSVRGFLSGTLKKRLGLTLSSERPADGARRYKLILS